MQLFYFVPLSRPAALFPNVRPDPTNLSKFYTWEYFLQSWLKLLRCAMLGLTTSIFRTKPIVSVAQFSIVFAHTSEKKTLTKHYYKQGQGLLYYFLH